MSVSTSIPPGTLVANVSSNVIPLSKAAHRLMSMVTLYVGQDRIKYHAYEADLCQVPFFWAALQEEAKGALHKSIDMPEDDPGAVAALIMCTSPFGYEPYVCRLQESTLAARGILEEPSKRLLEALFHLEVRVLAFKYDNATLLMLATKDLFDMHEHLSPIEMLQLWRAQATTDLGKLLFPRSGSAAIVRGLLREHREELTSTIAKLPLLGVALLETWATEACY